MPVVTSPRAFLRVDGQVIPVTDWKTSCEPLWTEEFGLDEIEAVEITPGIVRVFGVLTLIRSVADGGAEGWGLGAPVSLIPRKKYSSMVLLERTTRAPIFQYDGMVVFGPQNWGLPAKGIMLGTVSFKATQWSNELTGASG